MYFGMPQRQLFGAMHLPVGPVRALVLMCPPLLHEQQRSYRFFSQLADRLAEAGLACLRFDYFGTGDSAGEDGQFTPASAQADIALAARELRSLAPPAPLIMMGVRGSALLAHHDAVQLGASALWLWQPVLDGRAWLETLIARDRAERSSRNRYPIVEAEPASDGELMGTILTQSARDELSALAIVSAPGAIPTAVLDAPDGDGKQLADATHYALPASVTAWAREVDLSGLIPLRDAEPALQALLAELPLWISCSPGPPWTK